MRRAIALALVLSACTAGPPDGGNVRCPPPAVGGDGVTQVPVGGRPESVFAADGRIWVQRFTDDGPSLVSLDPDTGEMATSSITLPHGMNAFANDGAGRLWAVAGGPGSGLQRRGIIYRFALSSGRLQAEAPVPGRPSDLALGFGALWVVSEADNVLTKLDPDSLETLASVEIPRGPRKIELGADAVWVHNSFGRTSVFRVHPETAQVEAELAAVSVEAIDGDDVWAVGPGRPNGAIFRMDPSTGEPLGELLATPIAPVSIAAQDGSVWVARWVYYCEQKHPVPEGPPIVDWEVQQLDPDTMRYVGRHIPTGAEGPQELLPAFGALWNIRRAEDAIVRISIKALGEPTASG